MAAGPTDPIFVVGTMRSGTTLLAAMLDGHSGIACGPETAFFRFARSLDRRRVLADPAWPDQAVRFLHSLERERAGSILDAYGLTTDDVRHELEGAPRSPRSLLEAIVVPYARKRGKRRWAEKTPGHIVHLAELRRLWPRAPILRMVRDPRAVAASIANVPFGPTSVINSAYLWKREDDGAEPFFETDRLARTIRYEDLVADPEAVLRGACGFLGEEFEAPMLDTSGAERNVVASGEPWKWRVTEPIDRSRATAWQDELSATDQERVALVCSDGMLRHGYEGGRKPVGHLTLDIVGSRLHATPVLRELAADAGYLLADARADGRLGSPAPDMIIGPGEHGWTTSEGRERVVSIARLTARLAAARLRGHPTMRIDGGAKQPGGSSTEVIEDRVVRVLTRRIEPRKLRQFGLAGVAFDALPPSDRSADAELPSP